MFDNKYVKGFIGLGILAAAIAAFLVWPSTTPDETVDVMIDDLANALNEENTVRASVEAGNTEAPAGTDNDALTKIKEAGERVEDAPTAGDDLEGEVVNPN